MKALRWAGLSAAALLALLAASALTLRILFPPARVKTLALAKLSAALGRQVRLADAAVSLRGARLEGLEVSEVPDFKAGTALKARVVRVSPQLWPLLARRAVIVDELAVQDFEAGYSPKAAAKPAPKAAAKSPGPTAAPSAPRAAAGAAFSVARLSLSDGVLTYKDAGFSARLSKVTLTASGVKPSGPVPVALSFDFRARSGGTDHAGAFELKGKLDAAGGDLGRASLSFTPLAVTLDGLKAKAAGAVTDFLAPRVDAELSLPSLSQRSHPALASLPPGMAMPALSGPLKLSFGPKGASIEKLDLKGDLASLALKAAQDGTRWKVSGLALTWGAVSLTADGTADTGAKGGPTVDVKARLAPLSLSEAAELVPGGDIYAPSGTMSALLSAKGPAAAPGLSGDVTLTGAAATVSGQRLEGVDGKLTLSPDSAAGHLKGRLNGLPFDATLDGRDLKTAPRLKLDARLDRLDLAAAKTETPQGGGKPSKAERAAAKAPALLLAPAAGPAGKPFSASGTLVIGAIHHPNFEAAESKFGFDIKGRGSDLTKVDGSVTMRIGPGKFDDLKLVAAEKPMLKALLLPLLVLQKTASLVKVPLFPRFDTMSFSEITGSYAMKDGVLTVKQSKLDGGTADAELSGTADLVKDALDLRAKVRIGGQGAVHLSGTVAFKVAGSLAAPSVSLDATSILHQPAVQKTVDEAVKQGRDLLKNIFK